MTEEKKKCEEKVDEKRIVKYEIVGELNRNILNETFDGFCRKGKIGTECETREPLLRLIPATIIVVSMIRPLCSLIDVNLSGWWSDFQKRHKPRFQFPTIR